jgi:polyphosphate glucokinase
VAKVAAELKAATQAEYVVIGGGNARLLKKLPPNTRLGDNDNAFRGGFRVWNPPSKESALRGRLF